MSYADRASRGAVHRGLLIGRHSTDDAEPVALRNVRDDPGGTLARRELETLARYARLGDQRAVSVEMGITLQTVKNHVSSAYLKLGARSNIEAFHILGWLSPPALNPRQEIGIDRASTLRVQIGYAIESATELARIIAEMREEE